MLTKDKKTGPDWPVQPVESGTDHPANPVHPKNLFSMKTGQEPVNQSRTSEPVQLGSTGPFF